MTARLDRAAARSALRKARRMTHSHDTSTPAMSAETVPSEEFVLVPREATGAMLRDGVEAWTMPWADVMPPDIDEDRFILAAIYRAMIAAAPAPNPSPAAKGGDAVRERFDCERDEDAYTVTWPDGRWLVVSEDGTLTHGKSPRSKDFAAVRTSLAALSTLTEGPAPKLYAEEVLDEIEAMLEGNQGDDDGLQIMPDYPEGADVVGKVAACIALLERRRDIVEAVEASAGGISRTAVMWAHDQLLEHIDRHHRLEELSPEGQNLMDVVNHLSGALIAAALTPPETAEAVPDDLTAAYMAGVERGREEAARLREDLEREIKASVSISETLIETRRLYRVEKLRADDAVKALEEARAATASDPAPATDDRERLVEENARLQSAMLVLGAYLLEKGEAFRVGEGAELVDAYSAALATEASR